MPILDQSQREVSIPFREDLYSDNEYLIPDPRQITTSFHPFQGRPLFGHRGKRSNEGGDTVPVSIPFREDLYSDTPCKKGTGVSLGPVFPSLSGKTSIRTAS